MSVQLSPSTTGKLIAMGRIAVGITAFARPQVGGMAFTTGELPAESVDGWRLAGARDITLGLGAVMAAGKGEGRLRGWVEAGALADLMDVVVFATSSGLRPAAKAGGAFVALAAASAGFAAAHGLTRR